MKKIATLLILFLFTFGLTAQNNVPIPKSLLAGTKSPQNGPDSTNRKLKFIVGGNVGFQIAGNVLDMQIAPHIGIQPGVDFLCFGIGGFYQLTYYKNPITAIKSLQHIVGGNVFVEGYVWQRLILHAEYEVMSFPAGYTFTNDPFFVGVKERPSAHGILLGPGYKQDIGTDASVYTVFLFSVYDPQNVRGIMDIRVGFNYKF